MELVWTETALETFFKVVDYLYGSCSNNYKKSEMRKVLLVVIFIYSNFLFSQGINDFRINFGIQYNVPAKYFNDNLSKFNSDNAGAGFHIYPKLYVNRNFSLGMNIEYAIVQEKATTDNLDAFGIFSISPTVNYYFINGKIRPFIGTGVGLYRVSRTDRDLSIGIRPLIGVTLFERFDLSCEYTRILGDLKINPLVSKGFGNYYVSLKASYCLTIAGGKNKNKH